LQSQSAPVKDIYPPQGKTISIWRGLKKFSV